jgi:hypothetical protein
MQEPSCVGKIALMSMWFRMVLTQIITRVDKDSVTLRSISIKYHYSIGITFLIPMDRFFDTIINIDHGYHALTYIQYHTDSGPNLCSGFTNLA